MNVSFVKIQVSGDSTAWVNPEAVSAIMPVENSQRGSKTALMVNGNIMFSQDEPDDVMLDIMRHAYGDDAKFTNPPF